MKFVLQQYDTELISFDLWSKGLDDFVCKSLRFMPDGQRKLIDFRFSRDRSYNLPSKRLKVLEVFLPRCIIFLIFEGKSLLFSGRIPVGGNR